MNNELLVLNLDQLMPDPNQPRKDFDEGKILELAESLTAVGQAQAIRIRKNPDQLSDVKYMIIAGERRWQASKVANLETIECVLVGDDLSDDQIYSQQLTENLHREDLNPVEKAEFIKERIDQLKKNGVSDAVSEVAKELGVSNSWVSRNTAILKYDKDLRDLARIGLLRDYEALKKINKLPADKKNEALRKIQSGTFVAKDFFSRKRYDKKVKEIKTDVESVESVEDVEVFFKINVSKKDWIFIIEKTEYNVLLNRNDINWKEADKKKFSLYIKSFLNWSSEYKD